MSLTAEVRSFTLGKLEQQRNASQLVALFLICGINLAEALGAAGERHERIVRRIQRLIERERLRGQRGHWSYDLNRHIALKQALDRLRSGGETTA